MPFLIPNLDDRKFQELLDEALVRIPVHNPEWTNFNKSDPGVTLVEIFAFLTENLLYRANQVPERNRLKFLSLLGVPLQPASAARGLVNFINDRGPLATLTLNSELEVRAGQIPFRTKQGLDVLPVEARVYYKRKIDNPDPEVVAYYRELYRSFLLPNPPDPNALQLYETVPLAAPTPGSRGVSLGGGTTSAQPGGVTTPGTAGGVTVPFTTPDAAVDGLWIALLVRANDRPYDQTAGLARQALANKTLTLGLVPWLADSSQTLPPVGQAAPSNRLLFQIPVSGSLPANRVPQYRALPASFDGDVLTEPGTVQISLPAAADLALWDNIDPLEMGVDQFPPTLEDTALNERLITWVRISAPAGVQARLLWVGINTVSACQEARVTNERLPDGTGEPDQAVTLGRAPVIQDSVRLYMTVNGKEETWQRIDDLVTAGPEVPAPDLRLHPGAQGGRFPQPVNVFQLDAEAGKIQFGDGTHGKRPPLGALLRADYAYSAGKEGNLGSGAINASPALPAGIQATNPIATWGGADAETMSEGEKQISRYLQHRDRLVTVADFETITWRTPGVEIGRVEVLPTYHPGISVRPGDAPGAVTLMVIPRDDPLQPEAPLPNQVFLNTICDYLDPRRLVTTEIFLRPPEYLAVWVSVGFQVAPGLSAAQVRMEIERAIRQFLSPLPAWPGAPDPTLPQDPFASGPKGWPLGKPVVALELLAVASRVSGVLMVENVLLARGETPGQKEERIELKGLQLPRLKGLSVVVGEPLSLDQFGGVTAAAEAPPGPVSPPRIRQAIPVPVIPEECR